MVISVCIRTTARKRLSGYYNVCVRTTARKRSCGYYKCVCQDYSQEEGREESAAQHLGLQLTYCLQTIQYIDQLREYHAKGRHPHFNHNLHIVLYCENSLFSVECHTCVSLPKVYNMLWDILRIK